MRPTQGVEIFGNISSPFCAVVILLPLCKFYGDHPRETPSSRQGVKRKTGSEIKRWWTYRRLVVLINGIQDTASGTINDL